MDNEHLSKIIDDSKQLSSLPQTLTEVLRVARDSQSGAQELAEVLMRDPALTAKVLRIVNSPFYGVAREISTMTQAVVTLGTRQVTALALSASVFNMAAAEKPVIDRTRFWRHSLEVAIGARDIAKSIGYAQWEDVFVAGLLHDIGMLILESSYPEESARIFKDVDGDESVAEREEEVWSTNHARVGQFLLEQWHLPAIICEAVGRHHHVFPQGSCNSETIPSQIVSLSNLISRFSIIRLAPRDMQSSMECREGLRKNLGMTVQQLAEIEETLFTRTLDEAAYLELDVGRLEDILAEANKLMFEQYMVVENLLRENRKMQKQIAKDQIKKAALESLQTIAVTFNHYINNASAIILGRAQLVEAGIKNGQIGDDGGQLSMAMQIITNSVETIGMVMEELKNLASFETTVYHDDTYILDIERKIKSRLDRTAERVVAESAEEEKHTA